MVSWKKVNTETTAVLNSHNKLIEVFDGFAKHVAIGLNKKDGYFKGIDVDLQLEKSVFYVTAAGRTVAFSYKTVLLDGFAVIGSVSCYLKSDFQKEIWTFVNEFTFDHRGKTDQEDDEDKQYFYIDTDLSATCVVMYFVNQALKL